MTESWSIRHGVPPELAPAAARLYWRHFGRDLQPLPLSDARGTALVRALMHPGRALLAATPCGRVLAIAGLRDAQGGFLDLRPEGFITALGPLHGRARHAAMALYLGAAATPDLVLDGVAVHPDWRRQGLARALVARAEAQARRSGYPALRVEVAAANSEAQAAWQAMGFHPAGRQRLGWPWRPPAHLLRRAVDRDRADPEGRP